MKPETCNLKPVAEQRSSRAQLERPALSPTLTQQQLTATTDEAFSKLERLPASISSSAPALCLPAFRTLSRHPSSALPNSSSHAPNCSSALPNRSSHIPNRSSRAQLEHMAIRINPYAATTYEQKSKKSPSRLSAKHKPEASARDPLEVCVQQPTWLHF